MLYMLETLGVINYNFFVIIFMFTLLGIYLQGIGAKFIVGEDEEEISIKTIMLSYIVILGTINFVGGYIVYLILK